MKRICNMLCLALLLPAFVSCDYTDADNRSLDYESLDVNVSATINGTEWKADDVVGLLATCTRNEEENTQMSTQSPACMSPLSEGTSAYLAPKTEADAIKALKGDHNYKFYAYAPYDEAITDFSAIPADIPSEIEFGEKPSVLYLAKGTAAKIVAPVSLNFKSLTCVMELQIPDDIVADELTRLKTMELYPADATKLAESLTYEATYNMYTDELNVNSSTVSKKISLDFGAEGYQMEKGYTSVSFLIAPFTIPEGGFKVKFTDMEGYTNEVPLLAKAADAGKKYEAGQKISELLSSSSDGIVGCTSPVEWPIGYRGETPMVTTALQPRWNAGKANIDKEHVWTASQPQASLSFNIVDRTTGCAELELNNSENLGAVMIGYNYASPCVKWTGTGDYFEFEVPVKRFKAGTKVTLTLPTYGRGNPLFWDVLYLDTPDNKEGADGEGWKCNRTTHTSGPDRNVATKFYTKECTLMIEHGELSGTKWAGNVYTVEMTFENEIKSGYLRIRLKCVDHMVLSSINRAKPELSVVPGSTTRPGGTAYDQLLAFVCGDGSCPSIKIEW